MGFGSGLVDRHVRIGIFKLVVAAKLAASQQYVIAFGNKK